MLRLILLCLFAAGLQAQNVTPIPYAHAHNDYEHERPLLDALAQGFTSIEADVWAIDGELYVYHNRPDQPDPGRTLKTLYLEPLRQQLEKNGGKVYPAYKGHFQLMIDLKTEAESTYALIRPQLEAYRILFSRIENGGEVAGPVMVFLSGNRPVQTILQSDSHIARLDGRPEDMGKGYPAAKMPVISENYGKVLSWNGTGKFPKAERKKLKGLIKDVHREHKKLRLWAMPAAENAWTAYLKLGMDWINADDLERLKRFYLTGSK